MEKQAMGYGPQVRLKMYFHFSTYRLVHIAGFYLYFNFGEEISAGEQYKGGNATKNEKIRY
jgi:hypothetical protein